ncbi:hypothetical protein KP509_08G060100 [Ceratopteris richardii]|uniref:Uncharacterized protein n=1 Tax=Ceratopteris richardii TaxID=49495 RepID=A0A8T2UAW3_CERRI|nr:hypothetical protein KP509_08G060100 [Ceratopteris richardii]
MEELQELAALQSKISLLSRYALSSQHSSDDLLLAKFVLLLVEYCRNASDMSKKCTYLAIQLQKVSQSQAFLEDLFNDQMSSTRVCGFNKLVSEHPTSSNCMEEPALISLRDLERANSTLEDFCRSYFMFHEMDVQIVSNIFKHLPTLAFVEAFIYKIDEQREGLLLASEEILSRMVAEDDSFQPLHETLLKRNLWTSRIEEELKTGLNYWKLEQTLCKSLLLGNEISISDVMKAVRLKSFDYRVLNLLLYKILDQPVNELHMEFLEASELLVEISDDLSHFAGRYLEE